VSASHEGALETVRIVRSPDELRDIDPTALTITVGNFDGFHRGHAAVFTELVETAAGRLGKSVAVTFEPHPIAVVSPDRAPGLLTPTDEKAEIIAETGLDTLLVVDFTSEVANEDAHEFLSSLRVGRGSHLVLGYNFHMGRGRCCDIGKLSELGAEIGYGLDVIPPVEHDGRPISSTRIRRCVAEGRVDEAHTMMGRPYSLRGEVVAGDGAGRLLMSPTANLRLPEGKLLPRDGVYRVSVVSLEGRTGLLYVGSRPTFGEGERRAEVHVLDLDADLYGRTLSVDVLELIRGERRFESTEELARQIAEEIARAGRGSPG